MKFSNKKQYFLGLMILLFSMSINMFEAEAVSKQPCKVYGKVQNADNKPLQGVLVELILNGEVKDSDITDNSGYYAVTGSITSRSEFTIRAYRRDFYKDYTEEMWLSPGEDKQYNIRLWRFAEIEVEVDFTTPIEKGQSVTINISVECLWPSTDHARNVKVKLWVNGSDWFPDWLIWKEYNLGTIPRGTTKTVYFTIGPIYQDPHTDYYYALNHIQDPYKFNVKARANATNAATDWDEEELEVDLPDDGSHVILTFILVANTSWYTQWGGDATTVWNDAFNRTLTNDTGYNASMDERYDFTRIGIVYTGWELTNHTLHSVRANLTATAAEIIWGGTEAWPDHDEWHSIYLSGLNGKKVGTNRSNHGFDLLIGMAGVRNNDSTSGTFGWADMPGNHYLQMAGHNKSGVPIYTLNETGVHIVLLHEFCHLFAVPHQGDTVGYLMSEGFFAQGFKIHNETHKYYLGEYTNRFDYSWVPPPY
jgi:hypothetical protein